MIIQENVSLKDLSTFGAGGNARYFCEVSSTDEIAEAIGIARDNDTQTLFLGGGSNTLFSDEGFRGLVVKINFRGIRFDGSGEKVFAKISAGENWDEVVKQAVEKGYWGIENLSGIPGTAGAAPIQNIGAYGSEIKDALVSVEVFDTDTFQTRILTREECRFSYRDSVFKSGEGKRLVVTAINLCLRKNGVPNIAYKDLKEYFGDKKPTLPEIREAVLAIRSRKFPDLDEWGTAGSFFKNPIIPKSKADELRKKYPDMPMFDAGNNQSKIPLAWILDKILNLKGFTVGNAMLWKDQPLVMVLKKGGSAGDVRKLSEIVAQKVKVATGIDIEREVNIL